MRRALAGALCALALTPAAAQAASRTLLVFVPGPADAGERAAPDPLLRGLDRRSGLAVGLMSPTQGKYSADQALLDITQGARTSPIAYSPREPGALRLAARGRGGVIVGWTAAVARAAAVPGDIVPGRLASAIPGGAGFAGVTGASTRDAAVAADRRGRVAAVSLGPATTLAARARELLRRHRLVIAQLPPGTAAGRILDRLLAARSPDELVIVAQSPPSIASVRLLPVAITATAASRAGLTSDTTATAGLVAAIDVLPTILRHLGRPVPTRVTGQPIRLGELRTASQLERLRTRYTHVAPRRLLTLEVLLATWALLTLALAAARGWAGARRGLRLGGLAFLWVPSAVLVPAALDPAGAGTEAALAGAGAFVAAALTDRLLPWPRGPLLPAAVAILVYTVDLATGTGLTTLSTLGPNPRSGARFFGVGNEIEAALPILLFTGLAAAFAFKPRSRAMAWTFGVLGAALAVMVGSGYLGADVGGVLTVSSGTAVAALAVMPGGLTRRAVAVAACVPVAALVSLAALDALTGASSHFSRNVLQVNGGASLWEVIGRRYGFAWHTLKRGLMPLVTGFSLAAGVAALAMRGVLYRDLPGPAWTAALLGGWVAGVVGGLTNDSGPILFVEATFILGTVTAYLLGRPGRGPLGGAEHEPASDHTSGPPRAAMQESRSPSAGSEGGRPPATVP